MLTIKIKIDWESDLKYYIEVLNKIKAHQHQHQIKLKFKVKVTTGSIENKDLS